MHPRIFGSRFMRYPGCSSPSIPFPLRPHRQHAAVRLGAVKAPLSGPTTTDGRPRCRPGHAFRPEWRRPAIPSNRPTDREGRLMTKRPLARPHDPPFPRSCPHREARMHPLPRCGRDREIKRGWGSGDKFFRRRLQKDHPGSGSEKKGWKIKLQAREPDSGCNAPESGSQAFDSDYEPAGAAK